MREKTVKHREEFEKYKTLADELETNKEAILVRERYIADIMLHSHAAIQLAKRMNLEDLTAWEHSRAL